MGWKGWTWEQTMATPLAAFEIAIAGTVDYVRKTNPFGGADAETAPTKKTPQQIRSALHAASRQAMRGR